MNSKVKPGVFFGVIMSVSFIVENLLVHDNPTSKEILRFVISGLVGGIISGLFFGYFTSWFLKKFTNSKFVNDTTKIELDSDEKIIFQSGANHFKGLEAVGGKLYLTNKRLVFKSHKLNVQNHELTINLSDISKRESFKPLRLTNNGLCILTAKNTREKFVVEKREQWLSFLEPTQYKFIFP